VYRSSDPPPPPFCCARPSTQFPFFSLHQPILELLLHQADSFSAAGLDLPFTIAAYSLDGLLVVVLLLICFAAFIKR
jgi:hypothetical protein